MKILDGADETEAMKWFKAAAEVAADSLCLRAKCGAIIVKGGEVIGAGFNSPPQNNSDYRTCLNEYDIPAGFRHDRTCCIHAEQRAVADALKNNNDMRGARIYFIALDKNGGKVKAGDLKCTMCSRAVLDNGISGFALYCEDGICIYDSAELDQLSYRYKTPRVN